MKLKIELQQVLPAEIEKRSFEIITNEIEKNFPNNKILNSEEAPIIKRVIHTTADFDYLENLCFSNNVVKNAQEAIRNGAVIITDTNMVKSGINKKVLAKFGGEVFCFMSDDDVAEKAKADGTTRAVACMNKSALIKRPIIFAIGNAPTALVRIYELICEQKVNPELIIAVPVGFVNVVEAKELVLQTAVPYIISKGRKGGSNVAAAICNALLYSMQEEHDHP